MCIRDSSSPVYFDCGVQPAEREAAVQHFLKGIEDSLSWIDDYGRYSNDQQREDVKELFRKGKEAYSALL